MDIPLKPKADMDSTNGKASDDVAVQILGDLKNEIADARIAEETDAESFSGSGSLQTI